MIKVNRNKKSTFNKMLDIFKVAEMKNLKGGKTNKLSLENIDYWWLYYIDRNIRLIFILVKVWY
ncbi:hypothetical protein [Spiroplasma poulsonii]|uniref:hypothetical protein n=1 Tax=Spiroplasma poulsonii TaxID=2138 RepID=UPI001F4C68BF|nr:hypothetical protein [Spiroplasma poulsonii]UNF61693.1 hypothetical protein MNU24_07220 [Spiroplasma poulsonii]